MFTGIIQTQGVISAVPSSQLRVSIPEIPADWEPWKLGESVAINGVCLTVIDSEDGILFDVSPETYARTSLGSLTVGSLVNLERAMRITDRFGGHLVQGHVDHVGEVVQIQNLETASIFRFKVPKGYERYLIDKGSISIEGISLTVVSPEQNEFDTWIIPHTLEVTNLGSLKEGDRVNLEFDAMAKYAERLLAAFNK